MMHRSKNFFQVLPEMEKDILDFLSAERLTVYHRGRHIQEIVSKYKTGHEISEIRLKLTSGSIAGYVALIQQTLMIRDASDEESLSAIHPDLKHDYSYDRRIWFSARSMIVVPIKFAGKARASPPWNG